MVQGVDDIGDIFAHIAVNIPFPGKQFRRLVNQVRGQYLVDNTILKGFVKTFDTIGKQAESGTDKDPVRLSFLLFTGSSELYEP